jgi:hypothetical protein
MVFILALALFAWAIVTITGAGSNVGRSAAVAVARMTQANTAATGPLLPRVFSEMPPAHGFKNVD